MDNLTSPAVLSLLAASLLAIASYFVVVAATMQDPKEPPQASTSIPFIGHAVGIMRSKFNYYVQLSQKTEHDIFTMTMPGQKMYVVTSPELIQIVQKKPKTLAFQPIEAKFASTVCGVSNQAHDILLKNVNGDEGDWGLSMESYAAMREALVSGPGLDSMNRVMIENIASFLDEIRPSGQAKKVRLAEWLRYSVTLATTNSVYGPENPFKDHGIADAFWDFEADLIAILMGVLPSLTARKGVAGRAKVAAAFERYFKAGGHEHGSALIQNRYNTSAKNGVSIEDIAKYEVGGSIAILVNTAPAAFWMLLLVHAHPNLVDEIRKEIQPLITVENGQSGPTRSLDITSLKQDCPLLTSTFQEVLRFRSMGTSIRQVMEDTILQDRWLLKKGNMIQMPSRVVHMDQDIWGTDAESFEPRRFLKETSPKTSKGKRPNPSAFRAFGGGTTLCPGRHFATNEILAVVTMFIMRYDMVPTSGKWELPTTNNTNVAAVIMEPDTDIEVNISTRKGFEDGAWAFGLKDSEKIFAVVAEDKGEL